MIEKVKVGARGEIIIPKNLRMKHDMERGRIIEIRETDEGLLLETRNPVIELRGAGKGVFGDPVEYQKRRRGEWEP